LLQSDQEAAYFSETIREQARGIHSDIEELLTKELKKQYKSHIFALNKTNAQKDKEIKKLSSTISQLKNDKKNLKKLAKQKYNELEDIIFVKDLKIITLNNQIISFIPTPRAGKDLTIEPSSFNDFYKTKFWARRHENAKR
ncbi:16353_t:CDS:2, partial [Gigaspora margarita]